MFILVFDFKLFSQVKLKPTLECVLRTLSVLARIFCAFLHAAYRLHTKSNVAKSITYMIKKACYLKMFKAFKNENK